MTDISDWIADRLTADRDLEPVALGRLAIAIGGEEQLWRPLVRHDPDERYYYQLYRDPNVDIWLICWTGAQGRYCCCIPTSNHAAGPIRPSVCAGRFHGTALS